MFYKMFKCLFVIVINYIDSMIKLTFDLNL